MRWTDKRENVVPGLVDVALAGDEHRALALDLVSWLAEKIGGVQVVERFEASGPAAWFRALGDSLDRAVGLPKAIVDGLSSVSAGGAELTTGQLVGFDACPTSGKCSSCGGPWPLGVVGGSTLVIPPTNPPPRVECRDPFGCPGCEGCRR